MFGLEASDAADNTPEAEALEAVQVFSFPENFDVERLYGEHKLEKYRENSDMDDLVSGFERSLRTTILGMRLFRLQLFRRSPRRKGFNALHDTLEEDE